jgi:hypothetical protein
MARRVQIITCNGTGRAVSSFFPCCPRWRTGTAGLTEKVSGFEVFYGTVPLLAPHAADVTGIITGRRVAEMPEEAMGRFRKRGSKGVPSAIKSTG